MKTFFQFFLLLLGLFLVWKFWPSKTEPLPLAIPTATPDQAPPQLPTPIPTPTPIPVPSKDRYVKNLEEIHLVLTSDIVPQETPDSIPKRIYKKSELKESWEIGQEMLKQGVLTTKDAEHIVNFIKAMVQIQDLRNDFHDRYESQYNRPQKKLSPDTDRDYSALNIEWKTKIQNFQQQAEESLRSLRIDL